MRQVWYNGEFLPEDRAYISIFDEALMYGTLAFEMTRTFNQQIFKAREHFRRIENTCKVLRIELPYHFDELLDIYKELHVMNQTGMNEDDEIRGLINISRGTLPLYKDFTDSPTDYTIIMACFPLRYILKGKSELYDIGVDMVVTPQQAIPERYLDPKLKTRSRQHYKIADLQAGSKWALLVDEHGFVSEGTGSNIFIVKDQRVYTPYGINCLRGISREFVQELCSYKMTDDCKEINLTVYDVITADEAFLTCTPYSILPVNSINGYKLSCPGKIMQELISYWSKKVNCDFVAQAKEWDNV